ncbi:hypothetical protein KP79_PYT12800 [Mizuhopecten yessoensis]|uniref:Uncharacterized protein n=1 Tax=Mizuhopecten yessoensis TaxID=6573 RepID=A0A210PNM9_MIZYE|nr:hypothetical protein KP79_PYT12800 [Mizuhopecten yessoensis]
MDAMSKDFDHLIDKSLSDGASGEVLKVLKKKWVEATTRRGKTKKKTTSSSAWDRPIEHAARNLSLARSQVVVKYANPEKKGNAVSRRDISDLLLDIVKAVFDFVSEEQREQIRKIADLLHVDEQEKGNILNLQRTLGYAIEKALYQKFFDEVWPEKICKPYSTKLPSQIISMRDKDRKHDQMRNFVDACIKLVWLMLLETPPLVFCWEISKSHYRYPAGERGEFHINDRVIVPAITIIKHENGKREMKNVIKGLLLQDPS